MAGKIIFYLLVILILSGASFFFALAESALFSLGKWRARQLAASAPEKGALVLKLLDAPQDLLATIVLGNVLANTGLVATAFWLAWEQHWPAALPLAVVLPLILLGCEVLPKTIAVRVPDPWALRVARPMWILQRIARPFRRIAQQFNAAILKAVFPHSPKTPTGFSEAEYQELIELGFQQGSLGRSEKEIILQILSLERRTVGEVMRPRSQMACIPDDLPVEEMIAAARKYKHRRLPVYDETPDTIVGVLNTRVLLLNPQADLEEAIEFPSFVPESMNLLKLLKSLQRQQRGLAIALDEFGGTAGIVTTEDILEVAIGEIRSEMEPASFVMEKLGPGRWRVSGHMRLDDFRREYGALEEPDQVDTLGGLLVAQLEVVPQAGQSVVYRGLRLTAQVVDDRRVREMLVETV